MLSAMLQPAYPVDFLEPTRKEKTWKTEDEMEGHSGKESKVDISNLRGNFGDSK